MPQNGCVAQRSRRLGQTDLAYSGAVTAARIIRPIHSYRPEAIASMASSCFSRIDSAPAPAIRRAGRLEQADHFRVAFEQLHRCPIRRVRSRDVTIYQ